MRELKYSNYVLLFLILTINYSCSDKEIVNEFKVATVFSNRMVLQQDSSVSLWGSGEPSKSVKVQTSWGELIKSKIDKNGTWKVLLKTPKSKGLTHKISVTSGDNKVEIEDVLLGEVWLASGQSNMEWPMAAKIDNQAEEILNANYPKIRFFNVFRNLNDSNLEGSKWEKLNPENAKNLSAVSYYFARKIRKDLNVPVGIIVSAWGGTRVEAWTSLKKLADMKPSSNEAKQINDLGNDYEKSIELKNREIIKSNENYLNIKSIPIPNNISEWESLVLNDEDYFTTDFDDSQWDSIYWPNESTKNLKFEDIFMPKSFAEDGVVWFRKNFDVKNPNETFYITVENGIDDYDYTYINGKHIGTTLACCMGRKYEIPAGVIKEKNNLLAMRIIDVIGEGGFKSNLYIESESERIQLDKGNWRFKHHAFFLDTSFQPHSFNFTNLSQKDSIIKNNVKRGIGNKNPNRYGILYQTMIKPLIPYKIKGVIWYQGESNVPNFQDYKTLFSGMILDWRENWGANFPFYFAQIAPYQYDPESQSQSLREAQRKTLDLEKTGMVITLDIGEEKDIHPSNKKDVGERFARLALVETYGIKGITPTGPLYKNKTLYPKYIDLSFEYVGNGLVGKENLQGFEIAGMDGEFYKAKASIIGDKVRVMSQKVKNPKLVRYGWKNYFKATLYNKDGLPASSFETN